MSRLETTHIILKIKYGDNGKRTKVHAYWSLIETTDKCGSAKQAISLAWGKKIHLETERKIGNNSSYGRLNE